ncbi:hypothetical protein LRB11_12430 [Ectothiorhodospira haloalkaliphila]|uniref:hypothetical protein n=1 Tax=Ectothiorhodospira haloalkaliphila TaxID=421628 RepID=UPI001EE8218F|nr:hypothetical protein [Ectothiorhodospira haloalkaliphila]MCG5525732.1 hypothetical protein [Ectothiorhodospira haloalkaliphila]
MSELFATGRIVDFILLAMLLEGALLLWWHRRTGRGLPADVIVTTLLAGGFLLLALRAALTGADWPWISLWLSAGLLAHLADLWRRLR